jgi:hypothetical protein
MTEVEIPFSKRWKKSMLENVKVVTSRTKKMGEYRDTFPAFGATFQIMSVGQVPYGTIATKLYRNEGCDSEQEFRKAVKQIWWGKEPKDDRLLWVHWFIKLVPPCSKKCPKCGSEMRSQEGVKNGIVGYWYFCMNPNCDVRSIERGHEEKVTK